MINLVTSLPPQISHRPSVGFQPVNTPGLGAVSFGGMLDQLDRAGKVQDRPSPPSPPVRRDEPGREPQPRAQRKQDDADASRARGADALDSSRDRHARPTDEVDASDQAIELGEQDGELLTDQAEDSDDVTQTSGEILDGALAGVIGLPGTEQHIEEAPAAASTTQVRAHTSGQQQVERSTQPTSSVAIVTEAPQETGQQDVGGDQEQDAGTSTQDQVTQSTTNQRSDATDPLSSTLENSPGRSALSNGASAANLGPSAVGHVGTPMASPAPPGGELPQLTLPDTAADHAQLNVARIARGLQNALTQNGGSVTLRLTPPDLGTIRIQLQLQGATVNAQFHTETDAARSMLSNQIMQLRHALEAQGLTVDRLHVTTMNQSSSSSLNQQAEQSPEDGRSRGQYTAQQDREQSDNQDERQPQRQSIFEELFSQQDE